jgi:hypothetical protein
LTCHNRALGIDHVIRPALNAAIAPARLMAFAVFLALSNDRAVPFVLLA